MRKFLAIVAAAFVAAAFVVSAAAVAEPGPAAARFDASAIADAIAELPVQLAQHRPVRTRPAAPPHRATTSPRSSIDSTYRDPTTRGLLLNCSFC